MARSAQRNKRKPPQRPQRQGRRPRRSAPRRRQRIYEDEMFFPRLRRQAKWMFVVLALVFGLGYVIFNVGGTIPGTGLGDILQDAGGADGRPDVGDAEDKVADNPQDPPGEARARRRVHAERPARRGDPRARAVPRPAAARRRRRQPARRPVHGPGRAPPAGRRARAGRGAGRRAGHAVRAGERACPRSCGPRARSPRRCPPAANERLEPGVERGARSRSSRRATCYKRLGELTPDDSSVQFSLAQASEQAGDFESAIAAYKRFIKLAPDDPNVAGDPAPDPAARGAAADPAADPARRGAGG